MMWRRWTSRSYRVDEAGRLCRAHSAKLDCGIDNNQIGRLKSSAGVKFWGRGWNTHPHMAIETKVNKMSLRVLIEAFCRQSTATSI